MNTKVSNLLKNVLVAVDGEIAGKLRIESPNPESWEWESTETLASEIIEGNHPGKLPNTIRHLAPEGELAKILNGEAEQQRYVTNGMRFLGNTTIIANEHCLKRIPLDTHKLRLNDFVKQGAFTGYYDGPSNTMSEHFNQRVGRHFLNPTTPKFSGVQLKLPMTLEQSNGSVVLSDAAASPFTHILKYGEQEGMKHTIPAAEWMGLELSHRCGLETPEHALVQMPGENKVALLVERFDIPHEKERAEGITYFIADFCNISSINPHTAPGRMTTGRQGGIAPWDDDLQSEQLGKYNQPVEQSIQALMEVSSDPEADARAFYKRTVFAYFLRDMDMHMKNLSVCKRIDKNSGEIKTRFSPTYDALPTLIYPVGKRRDMNNATGQTYYEDIYSEGMALPVNGKTRNLSENDFIKFAEKLEIKEEEAEKIFQQIGQTCVCESIRIAKNPPPVLHDNPEALFALYRATTEIVEEAETVLGEDYSDAWDYGEDRVWDKDRLDFMERYNKGKIEFRLNIDELVEELAT